MRPASVRRFGSPALALLLAFAIVLAGRVAVADDACKDIRDSTQDDLSKLHLLVLHDCLGGANDRRAEIVELRKAIQDLPVLETPNRRASALDILGSLKQSLSPASTIPSGCRDQIVLALGRSNSELLKGTEVPTIGSDCVQGPAFAPTCWDVDPVQLAVPALPDCQSVLHDNPASDAAAAVVSFVVIVRDALGGFFAPVAKGYHAEATQLRGEWWTYFHSTRSQYPWELLLNAAVFGREIEKTKGQFHAPPAHQWILLHPDAALEYLKDAPDGQQFKPTLSMELVGINCWTWKKDKAARAIGGAIVTNYSDVASNPDWRFGGVIHVAHRYSFGATRASGHTGYFVSADLAEFFLDKQKKTKQFMEQLK